MLKLKAHFTTVYILQSIKIINLYHYVNNWIKFKLDYEF